jgi:ABC-type uncharacterized transport system auxiliary subunit
MMRKIGIILLLFGLLIGLSGCLGGTGRAPHIRQYVLEYPPPHNGGRPAVEAMVRVARFSANRLSSGSAMLYREGPFRREAYPEHRWWVSPADIVAEFLRRDLREAGLFRAVLSPRDVEEVRYSLEGGVEEFLESGEREERKAFLTATITLLDLSRKEAAGLVVFQKTYRCESAVSRKGASGLAAAMSLAMSQLSQQVIEDIDSALRRQE